MSIPAMMQKIAVTLESISVADLDRWVRDGRYPNRSRALQSAVDLLVEREKRTRLVRELKKLDPSEEQRMAEEGLVEERDLLRRFGPGSGSRTGWTASRARSHE
jgi:Arc/MetJ-type ribon-helix-helix transcriptional regulator